MSMFPRLPDSPDVVSATAPLALRYEDVCQDGRLMTVGMPFAMSSLWRESVQTMPIWEVRKAGILPILAQMWIRGTEDSFHVGRASHCEGAALLGHTVDQDGQVDRLLLDMSAKIFATRGSVLGPQSEGAGEVVLAGEVYARHVFTRLFAPAGQRRVRKFDLAGVPEVPPCVFPWMGFDQMLPMPEGAEWFDDQPVAQKHEPVFGLHHCDSNQHVNSLVYPRLFEDAAQQRFADQGLGNTTLSRQVGLNFRRPFFAGQRSRIQFRSCRKGEGLGATGAFLGPEDKTHCEVAMRFR